MILLFLDIIRINEQLNYVNILNELWYTITVF